MASSKFIMTKKRVNEQQKGSIARGNPSPATVEKTPKSKSFYCPRSLARFVGHLRIYDVG
eukprot:scaffold255145_cov86-Cyclotella_meneghiniana.AAC.2